jgi:hypothetical protein
MQPKCGQNRKGWRFQTCEPAYIWMRCRTKGLKDERPMRCACPAANVFNLTFPRCGETSFGLAASEL